MADESNGAAPAVPSQPPGVPPTPATPADPNLTKTPAKEGEAPRPIWVMPEVWTQTQDENRQLKAKLAELDRQAELATAERQRQEAEKGGYEKAVTEIRTTFDRKLEAERQARVAMEEKWLGEKRQAAINEALAGRQFTGDPAITSRMLRQLLESEVEAVLGPNGEPQIRDRVTLRPAADYLKERLESPALGIFFAAQTRGGSGTDGTRTPAANGNNDPTGDYMRQIVEMRKRAISDPSRIFTG